MRDVLYFPHLSPEEDWLRAAALIWDKVYIFATRRPRPLPDGIRRIDEGLGGILRPQRLDLLGESIHGAFWDWIEHAPEHAGPAIDGGAELDTIPEAEAAFEELYEDKFTESFLAHLERRGIARRQQSALHDADSGNPVDIVYLPRNIVDYYLSACAGVFVSERHRCDLFAHDTACASVAIDGRPIVSSGVSTTLMDAYLPETVATMSLQTLAAIRRDLAGQRLLFQSEIEKVMDAAARVSDPTDISDLQHTIAALAERQLKQTLSTYRRAKAGAVAKAVGAALVPGSVAWLASILGTAIFTPAAITAGLALLTATFLMETSKAKDDFRSSGWSYFAEVGRYGHTTVAVKMKRRQQYATRAKRK